MELICSVPAEPLPMQILALANNAGKANQVSSCKVARADARMAPRLTTCDATHVRVLTSFWQALLEHVPHWESRALPEEGQLKPATPVEK